MHGSGLRSRVRPDQRITRHGRCLSPPDCWSAYISRSPGTECTVWQSHHGHHWMVAKCKKAPRKNKKTRMPHLVAEVCRASAVPLVSFQHRGLLLLVPYPQGVLAALLNKPSDPGATDVVACCNTSGRDSVDHRAPHATLHELKQYLGHFVWPWSVCAGISIARE